MKLLRGLRRQLAGDALEALEQAERARRGRPSPGSSLELPGVGEGAVDWPPRSGSITRKVGAFRPNSASRWR
jgi:hypothetical protein